MLRIFQLESGVVSNLLASNSLRIESILMLHFLLETGFYNTTFWFTSLFFLGYLVGYHWFDNRILRTLALICLIGGTITNIGLAIYRAYSVPRDVLQDIVSAREYLAGRSLYPPDMTKRINDSLREEGERPSFLERWPEVRNREKEHIKEALTSHWVQAHPPFMSLFVSPFVKYTGILGTQIILASIALLSFFIICFLVRAELCPSLSRLHTFLIITCLLGWDPLLVVLRSGQSELILDLFMVLSWRFCRKNRPVLAGICTGIAISLKLVPALLLLTYLVCDRRSFYATIATVIVILFIVLTTVTRTDLIAFYHTSHSIIDEYGRYDGNISIYGMFVRVCLYFHLPDYIPYVGWIMAGIACAVLYVRSMSRWIRSVSATETIDRSFALALILMPLLSPISWDHYLGFLLLPAGILFAFLRRNSNRHQWLLLLTCFCLLTIPDAFYHWTYAQSINRFTMGLDIIFILPLRTYCLFVLIRILHSTNKLGQSQSQHYLHS